MLIFNEFIFLVDFIFHGFIHHFHIIWHWNVFLFLIVLDTIKPLIALEIIHDLFDFAAVT